MPHEIRFATFNAFNLALPETRFYDNLEPHSIAAYDAKIGWMAQQIDRLDADVIGFQEIFSKEALADVMARTRNYRNAQQIACDPLPRAGVLTPNVALVTRLPLLAAPQWHATLPRDLVVALPGVSEPMRHFTRPILQVELGLPGQRSLHTFVAHLKSKRPDWDTVAPADAPWQLGIATLRSLLRRGTEALGLRYLLTEQMQRARGPLLVLGDFNDALEAVSTQLVLGADGPPESRPDERLYDCFALQPNAGQVIAKRFTNCHNGYRECIDHVLVSAEFHPASPRAIGSVLEVQYLNEHLRDRLQAVSDHGQVLVRVRLNDSTA